MTWPDGGSYVGPWLNGLPHTRSNEKGTRIYGNGEQYVGQWRYGRRHGFGVMSAEAPTTSLSNSQEKTRGNSGEKTSSHRVVLYEGLFRDGNKSFQAELEADLVKPDHAERDLVRKNMSELGAVGAQADALVEKMLFNRSMPGKSTIRYTSSSKATKSSNSVKNSATLTNKQTSPKTITADDQDNAAHVSAYYVKKEKLKKIKHAWHPYPANVTDSPIR